MHCWLQPVLRTLEIEWNNICQASSDLPRLTPISGHSGKILGHKISSSNAGRVYSLKGWKLGFVKVKIFVFLEFRPVTIISNLSKMNVQLCFQSRSWELQKYICNSHKNYPENISVTLIENIQKNIHNSHSNYQQIYS